MNMAGYSSEAGAVSAAGYRPAPARLLALEALQRSALSPAFVAGAALIVGAAAVVRFWGLGQAPIWMDEAYSALVTRLPFHAILFEQLDVHPPLGYLIEKLWMLVVPSLAWMRVPAAIFGVLSILVLVAALFDLVSAPAALAAAAFAAVSTADIYFSQEARMYTILTFGLFLASWGALGLLRGRRLGVYAGLYLVGALVGVYSHVVALIYLFVLNGGCLAAWVSTPKSERSGRGYLQVWLAANLVLLVASTPWLLRIPATAASFPGLGALKVKDTAWTVAQALGYPGLPHPVEYAADAMLIALMGLGAVALWQGGRRPLAIAGLVTIGGYLALVFGLSRITPMVAVRIFLPLLMFQAMFVGAALAALRPAWVQAPAITAALGLMVVSSGLEHGARTMYENVPAALAYADQRGFAGAPILTCDFMEAGTIWAAAPQRADFFVGPKGEVTRYDAGYIRAVRMPFSVFMRSSASEIDRFLGSGYLARGGLAGVLGASSRVVVVTGPCRASFPGQAQAALGRLGLRPVSSAAFPGGRNGQVIISHGETALTLYARSA
jgi:hypothetical protein